MMASSYAFEIPPHLADQFAGILEQDVLRAVYSTFQQVFVNRHPSIARNWLATYIRDLPVMLSSPPLTCPLA